MVRLRALFIASHPGPSLAITAMATVLAAEAAPTGFGPVLVAPAMLAGQLSVGWSNDACDAARDVAAGRTDKPVARGEISVRSLWVAAVVSVVAALAMAAAISLLTMGILALLVGAGWAYNLGLKSTPWSGVMYLLGFGPLPAYAASTLPGQPAPRFWVCVAAALLGLGAHFVNVPPDLGADLRSGGRGLSRRAGARARRGPPPWSCCFPRQRCSSSRRARRAAGSPSPACASPAYLRWQAPWEPGGRRSVPRSPSP